MGRRFTLRCCEERNGRGGYKAGEVFWADVIESSESVPRYNRPYLIVQNDAFNRSRINTIVVCSLTSNLRRGPGQRVARSRRSKSARAKHHQRLADRHNRQEPTAGEDRKAIRRKDSRDPAGHQTVVGAERVSR